MSPRPHGRAGHVPAKVRRQAAAAAGMEPDPSPTPAVEAVPATPAATWAAPYTFVVTLSDGRTVEVSWQPLGPEPPTPLGGIGAFDFRGLTDSAGTYHYVATAEDRPDECGIESAAAAIGERLALRRKVERLRQEQAEPIARTTNLAALLSPGHKGADALWRAGLYKVDDLLKQAAKVDRNIREGTAYRSDVQRVYQALREVQGLPGDAVLTIGDVLVDAGLADRVEATISTPIVVSEVEQQAAAKHRTAARKGVATSKAKAKKGATEAPAETPLHFVAGEPVPYPPSAILPSDHPTHYHPARLVPAETTPSAHERDQALAAAGIPRCPGCGERDRCEEAHPGEWWCRRCFAWCAAALPESGKTVPDF